MTTQAITLQETLQSRMKKADTLKEKKKILSNHIQLVREQNTYGDLDDYLVELLKKEHVFTLILRKIK